MSDCTGCALSHIVLATGDGRVEAFTEQARESHRPLRREPDAAISSPAQNRHRQNGLDHGGCVQAVGSNSCLGNGEFRVARRQRS